MGELRNNFWWRRGRYEWFTPDNSSMRYLIRKGERQDVYQPPESLYRPFAHIRDQASVLAFANRFGWLGYKPEWLKKPDRRGARRGKMVWGEPLSLWIEQATYMRHALALWDAAREKDPFANVLKHINQSDDAIIYRSPDFTSVITDLGYAPWLLETIKPDDKFSAAMLCVQRLVNDNIIGMVSPRLVWNGAALEWQLVPSNLLGAMWERVTQAITENRAHKRCACCNDWFERRSDARFCSDRCKTRAHRQRKEKKQ